MITLLVARMGTWQQGLFALFTSIESTLLMLGSGFAAVIARQATATDHHLRQALSATVQAAVVLGVVTMSVLAIVSWHDVSARTVLLPLAAAATLMYLGPNLSGLWLGQGRMLALASFTVAPPLITLIAVGLLAATRDGLSIESVLWCWVLARSVVGVAAFVAARRSYPPLEVRWRTMRPELRFFVIVGFTNLVSMLNYKVDIFWVSHLAGLSEAGIYSIAVLVAELLWLASSAVSQAAYGHIGTQDADKARQITIVIVRASVTLLALVSPLLWVMAAWLLPLLLGPQYASSLVPLALLLPGIVAYGGASGFSVYFTNHAGRPRISAMLAGLSFLINLVATPLLVPMWGINGAAVATSLSYLVSMAVSLKTFCALSDARMRDVLNVREGMATLRTLVRSSASRII